MGLEVERLPSAVFDARRKSRAFQRRRISVEYGGDIKLVYSIHDVQRSWATRARVGSWGL